MHDGEQISHAENRVVLILADIDGDFLTAVLNDNAVQREGDCRPLILLYTAVIMGLEKCELLLLIKRVLLQIHAGGVDVSRSEADALIQRQLAHYTEYDRLFTVDKVELIPGFVFLSSLKLLEAGSLGKSYCLGNSLALGLSSIKESLVVLAEFGSLCNLFILQQEPCVLVV